jgi:hypothetical protein
MQKELYSKLDKYWQGIVDDLIKSLKEKDRYVSGVTAALIGGKGKNEPVDIFTVKTGTIEVQLYMPEYYAFLDEGVSGAVNNKNRSQFSYKDKGKGAGGRGQKGIPNVMAIRRFMRNRSIVPTNVRKAKNSKTKASKRQSAEDARMNLAFAISYNIWKNGTKKTNFYSDVVNDQRIADFGTNLIEYYGDYIIKVLSSNK